jgi:hypothetical protein
MYINKGGNVRTSNYCTPDFMTRQIMFSSDLAFDSSTNLNLCNPNFHVLPDFRQTVSQKMTRQNKGILDVHFSYLWRLGTDFVIFKQATRNNHALDVCSTFTDK